MKESEQNPTRRELLAVSEEIEKRRSSSSCFGERTDMTDRGEISERPPSTLTGRIRRGCGAAQP
jgi:hypothetical protein